MTIRSGSHGYVQLRERAERRDRGHPRRNGTQRRVIGRGRASSSLAALRARKRTSLLARSGLGLAGPGTPPSGPDAGQPDQEGPGLRREEVALLAGVSSDHYACLEQGRGIIPSPAVVDASARALHLDAAGRSHLHSLIQRNTGTKPQRVFAQRARPSLQQFVDSLDVPVMVLGRRAEVLATNHLARALLCDFERLPARERNYAPLDPAR